MGIQRSLVFAALMLIPGFASALPYSTDDYFAVYSDDHASSIAMSYEWAAAREDVSTTLASLAALEAWLGVDIAVAGDLHSAVTLGADAGTVLGLTGQQIDLDAQAANTVFAGPTSGGAADPAFRALVTGDLPSGAALDAELHDAVTLAGTPDYLTLAGQVLTRALIDLATDVEGNLPVTSLGGGTGASGSTFLRGDMTWATPAGAGNVNGPAYSFDNAIARFDGTSGTGIQNSSVYINDSGGLSTTGTLAGATMDTGQGANELYAMDQAVRTSDAPTFGGVTASGLTPTIVLTDTSASADDFQLHTPALGFAIRNVTDGRDDLFIDGTGRVAIGPVTPLELLDIAGDATAQATAIPTGRITNLDTTALANDVTGSFEFYSVDASDANRVSGFIRNVAEDAGTKYGLSLGTKTTGADAVQRAYLNSDGELFLTGARSWLDSSGNVYQVIDRGGTNRRAALAFVTNGATTENPPSTGLTWALGMSDSDEDTVGTGLLFFIGQSTAISSNPAIIINAARNVAIGAVTAPASKLSVEGNATIGATLAGTTTAPANGLLVEGLIKAGTGTPGTATGSGDIYATDAMEADGDIIAGGSLFSGDEITAVQGIYEQDTWRVGARKAQNLTPSADFAITVASGNFVRIVAGGTSIDITNITDGQFDGQELVIVGGASTDDVTLSDIAGQVGLETAGAFTINQQDTITLVWTLTDSMWLEQSRSSN